VQRAHVELLHEQHRVRLHDSRDHGLHVTRDVAL
jgi:hypothetical protein